MYARLLLVVFDVAGALIALVVCVWLTSALHPAVFPAGKPGAGVLLSSNPHLPAGWMLTGAWLASIGWAGGYAPSKMRSPARMVTMTCQSAIGVIVFISALHLGLRHTDWSRVMVASFVASATLNIAALRVVFFKLQPHILPSPTPQRVAIIGVGARAIGLAERLEEYGHHDFSLAGYLTPDAGSTVFQVQPTAVLGSVRDLPDLAGRHELAVLILATEQLSREEQMILANRANALGLKLLEMPTIWGMANPRVALADLGDLQLVDLTNLAYPTEAERLKRAFDLVVVGIGSVIISPLLVLIGLAIRLSDGGPALYTQARAGRGGRTFGMYKFRSMVEGAEDLRPALSNANEAEGVLFKMKDDPRITPFGRWIRRWSIDELPQVLNVLKGEMNLVGPRPLPIADLLGLDENIELRYWFTQRSKVRPGITGTWQISDRASLKMNDMVGLDIDYIQRWSLSTDLAILLKTLPAIINGRGAR